MKDIIFALLAAGLFLLPACEHDAFNQIDPDPTDTIEMPIDTLRCEDTIEMNYPGTMENGYIKAINTCRDWKASGKAKISSASAEHYFIDGNTFYPFILTTGDTAFFKAEGIGFYVPTKVGRYPVSNTGFKTDTVTGSYVYMNDDVFLSFWNADPSFPDNEFEILEIDTLQKRIKGRFNIHFIIDTTSADYQLYPSKFYFHEGEFDVKIVE